MSERDKSLEYLLERGLSEEEARNFLGTKVGYATLVLPPDKAQEVLAALTKFAVVSAPVEVRFCFSNNRYEKFIETAEKIAGQPVVNGTRQPGELLN
jgi:acyl-CoA synthetase (NDP forming)